MFTIEELRKIDIRKLQDEIAACEKDLFKAGFEIKCGVSKASHIIRQKKSYLSQLKTISNERKDEPKKAPTTP